MLSLPSFKWFASDVISLPRRTQQTCIVTKNRQMIMVGGLDPDQPSKTYDPQNWDASVDPWTQGIGVFDMSSLKYKDRYHANTSSYVSPDVIQRYYYNNDR